MFLYITVHLHLIASLSASSFSAGFVEQNVAGGSGCYFAWYELLVFDVWNLISLQNLHPLLKSKFCQQSGPNVGIKFLTFEVGWAGLQYT